MPTYTANTATTATRYYNWTFPYTASAGIYDGYYTGMKTFAAGAVDRLLRQEREDEEDYDVDEDAWKEFMMLGCD